MYRTVVTICTAQWSLFVLYVPPSGHYMYCAVVTICTAQWSLYVPPSGHYMYYQFNIQQFYVLPTRCIYVFCVDIITAIISLYNINWLVFITETECVYCAVRTGCFNYSPGYFSHAASSCWIHQNEPLCPKVKTCPAKQSVVIWQQAVAYQYIRHCNTDTQTVTSSSYSAMVQHMFWTTVNYSLSIAGPRHLEMSVRRGKHRTGRWLRVSRSLVCHSHDLF